MAAFEVADDLLADPDANPEGLVENKTTLGSDDSATPKTEITADAAVDTSTDTATEAVVAEAGQPKTDKAKTPDPTGGE